MIKSKDYVMKIVGDVVTSVTFTSLYHCNEKDLGLSFSKFYVIL